MKETELTTVKWDEIPRKDWMAILESIPIGNYIKDIPYSAFPYAPKIVIPRENLPWIQFEKYEYTDGTFSWKRTA